MKTIKKGLLLFCLLLRLIGSGTEAVARQTGVPENYRSLIPYPQQLQWLPQRFYLGPAKAIIVQSKDLLGEAALLQRTLAAHGFKLRLIVGTGRVPPGSIVFKKDKPTAAPAKNGEAYRVNVSTKQLTLTAGTTHGFFNGIQTIEQLVAGKDFIQGCIITDFPVYQWRGYMIDAARHFQSMALIKQQIDVMAAYKLNVLHFHFTDDQAWRLQIKKYPQLTSPAFMTRDKGRYYTVADVKALISYCRARHITFVPEIDMPGHSKAFADAMGADMQSGAGLKIVKEIIKEVCSTYHVPYFHIGADEVDIKNSQFIPKVTRLIRQYHQLVIAWIPGGKTDERVTGQWWDGDLKKTAGSPRKYIDSWYLYINHFDPENSVTNVLYRQIGNQMPDDSDFLGGELCNWPDRAISGERVILWQNPVYPSMLAFSERIWRGGGYKGVFANIGPDSSARAKEFFAFEKRLIDQKSLYFRNLPFLYVKQSHVKWKLLGPFNNEGKPGAAFWPEQAGTSPADSAGQNVTGATIWLRHFWANDVTAWLTNPAARTTYYAYTSFKCEKDTTLNFWIGFKDISRSHADDAPAAGTWDYQQSMVWLNNQPVPPPLWANAGKKASAEMPLADEGVAYRAPVKLAVKKGWNQLLVKLPVGSFDSENGNQAVKWMFTVVPVHQQGVNQEADDLIFCTDCK